MIFKTSRLRERTAPTGMKRTATFSWGNSPAEARASVASLGKDIRTVDAVMVSGRSGESRDSRSGDAGSAGEAEEDGEKAIWFDLTLMFVVCVGKINKRRDDLIITAVQISSSVNKATGILQILDEASNPSRGRMFEQRTPP